MKFASGPKPHGPVAERPPVGADPARNLVRYLPQVLLATMLVVLAPGAVVWTLASSGAVQSFLPLMAIGVTISLAVGFAARLAWQRAAGSQSLLFADLMLWGWIRRLRSERRLDNALALLGPETRSARGQLDPDARLGALKSLATSLESRDPYLHGHSRRVARYAAMIAERMGMSDIEVSKVRTAAAVHDVGKLEVPLAVLNKPGRLTEEEFDVIKTHAPLGAAMVKDLGDVELTEMVAHHHERLDGTGYPSRLAGEQIPLGARIIAVADTFDALTSTRAYRTAKRHKDALAIIHSEAGTQLDPLVVGAFDRCYAGSLGGLTVWALFAGLPHRLWSPLESQAHAATGAGLTKAITVVAATAATGGIAISSADPRDTNSDDDSAPVTRTAQASGVTKADHGEERASDPARAGWRPRGHSGFGGKSDREAFTGANGGGGRAVAAPLPPMTSPWAPPSESRPPAPGASQAPTDPPAQDTPPSAVVVPAAVIEPIAGGEAPASGHGNKPEDPGSSGNGGKPDNPGTSGNGSPGGSGGGKHHGGSGGKPDDPGRPGFPGTPIGATPADHPASTGPRGVPPGLVIPATGAKPAQSKPAQSKPGPTVQTPHHP